ncbi:patatin-like phospholipase family protein [Winogradskyella sp. 3972H.M.0a.05]|uniref:patatin-like phospholipase family protein n=1 Tax=Winogradskyella sp. 3972H.M.0a.05 TaxID=2950277 RepID=UPI0033948949
MKVSKFTEEVWDILNDLKEWEGKRRDQGQPFFMSNFWDHNRYQYINLVQEGGGMLGIALAGFTYIFEKMGIRFLGLGGTSAGSINSFLMAAIGKPHEEKSERILKHLINKNFMDFIDGGKDAKAFINFVSSKGKKSALKILSNPIILNNYWDIKANKGMNPGVKFEKWLDEILLHEKIYDELKETFKNGSNVEFSLADFVKLFSSISDSFHVYKNEEYVSQLSHFDLSEDFTDRSEAITHLVKLLDFFEKDSVKYSHEDCVEAFMNVVKLICHRHNIVITAMTLEGLEKQLQLNAERLFKIKYEEAVLEQGTAEDITLQKRSLAKHGELAIISAELTTQTKVIFPAMAELYFEQRNTVNPSKMVRASMSVPLLFEPVQLDLSWVNSDDVDEYNILRLKWHQWCHYKGIIPQSVFLVDGGIMSNFPIDVFTELPLTDPTPSNDEASVDPAVSSEHVTTIGVKLGVDRIKPKETSSVLGLLGQCFDNARVIRDNEAIYKNSSASDDSIAVIDTDSFNWLDFQMTEEKVKALFRAGAESAARFIMDFDYVSYQKSISSKSTLVTRSKLFSDIYDSLYYDKLFEAEWMTERSKVIGDDGLKELLDKIALPSSAVNYWIDKETPNFIMYSKDKDYKYVSKHKVSADIYNSVLKIQDESETLRPNVEKGVKNILLRISLIRNCFDMNSIRVLNKYPVLWIREHVNFEENDPYDKLIKELVDYAGAEIQELNHKDEIPQYQNNLGRYNLIVIKAHPDSVASGELPLFTALRETLLKYPHVYLVVYSPGSKDFVLPDFNVLVMNNRISLLHYILDIFHRHIY